MDNTQQIFPAFRLVAQFADGQRLTFDGLTEQQAQQSMEAAQAQHGDITWFDGVTDRHYENGRYYKLTPQPPEITMIDLTGYNEPQEEEWPMPVPEYRRRGNDRYNAKCDYISVRPIKSIGAAIRAAAKAADQSVQGYVIQACIERMKREGQPLELNTPDEPPEP